MKLNELKTVAVIGAGLMGHGIGQVALMAGYHLNLCDVKQEFVDRGVNLIYQSLDKFASKGKISEEAVAKIKESGITTYTSIAEAVKDAQFIVEAVPKRMDIKTARSHRFPQPAAQMR